MGIECIFFVFPAIVIGIIVLAIVFAQANAQKANQAWAEAARELGLHYKPGAFLQPRHIEGKYKGQFVQIDTFQRGSGKSSVTYTRYEVAYPESLNLGLRVSRQGFASQVWTFLGGQDIRTGDSSFDDNLVVKANDEDEVRRFLTASRRDEIYDLVMGNEGCTVDDNRIQCAVRGLETNARRLIDCLDSMAHVARYMSQYYDEDDDSIPQVLPARRDYDDEPVEVIPVKPVYEDNWRSDLPEREASEEAPPIPQPPPMPTQTDAIQADQFKEEPRWPSAAELDAPREEPPSPPPMPELPKMPAPADWPPKFALPTPAEPPAPENAVDAPSPIIPAGDVEQSAPKKPDSSIPPLASPKPADTKNASDVCEDLFHSNLMTHKITERFDEIYKNQAVRWQGKLTQVGTYFFDVVFGSDAGVKATFEIHEIAEQYSTNKIEAIVQLPAGTENDLRAKQGETLTFTGRLAGCDAFMRKLFVADGKIEDA